MKPQEEINQDAQDLIAQIEEREQEPGLMHQESQDQINQRAWDVIEKSQQAHDVDVVIIPVPVEIAITEEDEAKFKESDELLRLDIEKRQAEINAEAQKNIENANAEKRPESEAQSGDTVTA